MGILQFNKVYTRIAANVLFAFLVLMHSDSYAQDSLLQGPAKNVLIVNSYHENFEWTREQVTGIQEVFTEQLPASALFIEYLDTKRFPNRDIWQQIFSLELSKYPPGFIDLIISTDDNAFQTLLPLRDKVAGIPIIFSGLNAFEPEQIEGMPKITGIVEKLDFQGTYELACELTGKKYSSVAIITDNTVTGRAQKAVATKWFNAHPELKPVWLDGTELSFQQLQGKLRDLDSSTLVILSIWQRGRGGTYYAADTTYPLIEKAAGRPVFGVINLGVGSGVIGGSLLDGQNHGRAAGLMAVEVLKGKDISGIEANIDPSGHVMLDKPTVVRYGLEDRIRDGWEVINSAPGFYQRHKTIIIIASGVFVIESALILLLVFNVILRRLTAKNLEIANQTMRALHDAMPDLIMVVDINGNYLRIHEPGNRVLNISSTRHIGANLKDIFDADTAGKLMEHIRSVIETKKVSTIEYLRPDRKRWLEGHVAALEESLFGVPAVMWIARDIDNYKQAIAELGESRALYRSVVEDSPQSICVLKSSGEIVFCNFAYANYFGFDQDEIKGVSIYELIPENQRGLTRKRLASLTPAKPVGVNEHQVIAANGDIRWVRWTNRAFFDSEGNCETIQSFGEDFTDRITAEHQLRDNERDLRITLNSIGDGVISTDRNGTIMQMNQVAEKLTGVSAGDAIGEDLSCVFRIIDANTGMEMENPVGKVLRTNTIQGLDDGAVLLSHDGNKYHIADSAAPIVDEDSEIIGVVLIFRDVSAENEKDRLLRESQQQKEIVLQHTGEIISYLDTDLHVVWTNSQKLDGGNIPAGANCCSVMFGHEKPCEYCLVEEVIASGQEGMNEISLPTGETYQMLCTPVKDDSGIVRGVVAAARDITEQKTLRQQLIHSDRMSAIGRLAGGIAHDFNNLLQVIVGYGELLGSQVGSDASDALDNIMDAAGKARNLVKQLLVFSRSDQDSEVLVRPAAILDNTMSLLKPIIGEGILLEMNVRCGAECIQADSEKLQQVIMNICINARDAIGGNGRIVISAKPVDIDSQHSHVLGLENPGKYISFTIVDDGPGIDEDVIDHIFEPFYTTKEVGSGSGLGLATAYAIVDKAGGCIHARNIEAGGAEFEFLIPVSTRTVDSQVVEDVVDAVEFSLSGQKVLLAEDDPMVRQYSVRLLKKLGLRVTAAEDGLQAVKQFSKSPEDFDLVILDAIMPEMNGREAFDAIMEIRSDIPVLFATGYSSEILEGDFIANKPDIVLQKPFSAATLASAITKVVSG